MNDFPPVDAATIEGDDPPRRRRVPGRTARKITSEEPKAPRAPRVKASYDVKLAEALADPFIKFGSVAAFAAPTTGAVIVDRAQVTSEALVRFAADKPRLLASLKRAGDVGPVSDMIQTVIMIAIALKVDSQSVDPNSPIVRLSGVGVIHDQMMGHMTDVAQEMNVQNEGVDVPPPPGWEPTRNDAFSNVGTFAAKQGAAAFNPDTASVG